MCILNQNAKTNISETTIYDPFSKFTKLSI